MNASQKHRWVDGGDVEGGVTLTQFPLNFTLLNHAGISGLVFVSLWFGWHWQLWTTYNIQTFVVIMILFVLMASLSPQFANNISSKKLTFSTPGHTFKAYPADSGSSIFSRCVDLAWLWLLCGLSRLMMSQ